jgi:DNA replication protein DnaC
MRQGNLHARGKRSSYLLCQNSGGRTHLVIGLCLAACRQNRHVRFTMAAALVDYLVEAKQNNQVRKRMMHNPTTQVDRIR